MSILTDWSQQLPGWNLQQGLEMLLKPSNRRSPRTTKPKRAPFVVVEGIDSSGKTTHVEAVANALAHLHYSVRVITFPNNLTNPIRKVPEAYFAEGITDGVLDTTYFVFPT